MTTHKKDDLSTLKDYFNSLNIKDWAIAGNIRHGGQATTIEVKHEITGESGVFRILIRREAVDIKRFYRELKILTNPAYKHPNIVEILDRTADDNNQWYISKKGKQFDGYWQSIKKQNNPDQIALEAIEIIKNLACGLILLHKEKIVHRDIKMANIVFNGNAPQLIDFGIAFIEDEERITPLHNAAANKFSHQLQLNHGDVPPWLDVFLLSQLLISMTSEKSGKNWERPLDWRWIVFLDGINVQIQEKIKAIMAICSNPYTSPQDAESFINLIDILFYKKETIMTQEDKNYSEIRNRIQEKKAVSILEYTDDREMFEAQAALFVLTAKKIENIILRHANKLKEEQQLPVEIEHYNIDNWIQTALSVPVEELQDKTTFNPAIRIICGNERGQYPFQIVVYCFFGGQDMSHLPHYVHHFVISIRIQSRDAMRDRVTNFPKSNTFIFSPEARLNIYSTETKELMSEVTAEYVGKTVTDWLDDEKNWSTITMEV